MYERAHEVNIGKSSRNLPHADRILVITLHYTSGGTFFVGFIIEYLEKINAIILIIYSNRPFNVVCEHQVFALRGSDEVELIPSFLMV